MELRDVILARLDEFAGQHELCGPFGERCVHRALDGLRAAVVFAAEHPALILLEPVLLGRIADAMDIQHGEVSGG